MYDILLIVFVTVRSFEGVAVIVTWTGLLLLFRFVSIDCPVTIPVVVRIVHGVQTTTHVITNVHHVQTTCVQTGITTHVLV